MSYRGQEAYRLDGDNAAFQQPEVQTRRSFNVVEGQGLDAKARAGVSRRFLAGFRAALVAIAFLFVVGLANIAVNAATVSTLQENQSIKTEVSSAQDLGNQLRIESSVLSNSTRITRIATQNYGMVYAPAAEKLTVSVSE
jgi:cell division protein FtsL